MNEQLANYAKDLKSGKITSISYLIRNQIERRLYLVLNQFTLNKFGIELGGFTIPHRGKFSRILPNEKHTAEDIKIVFDSFKLYDLLAGLSSSDPYWVMETEEKSGGKENALKLLGEKIELFISSIQCE